MPNDPSLYDIFKQCLHQLLILFSKVWIYVFAIGMGLIGKFGKLWRSEEMSWKKAAAHGMTGICMGVLCAFIGYYYFPVPIGEFPLKASATTVIGTLISDRLTEILFKMDIGAIFNILIGKSNKKP